jgi:hypothetical protein
VGRAKRGLDCSWRGEVSGGAAEDVPDDVPCALSLRPPLKWVGEAAEGGGAGVGKIGASEGEGMPAKRPERDWRIADGPCDGDGCGAGVG